MSDLAEAARGHWPGILSALAGLSAEQLTDEHQPCPLCGGTDRYRFDDRDGSGSWFCNQCGGRDQRGGGGSGMDLLMRRLQIPYAEAAQRLEQHLGIGGGTGSTRRRPYRQPERPPADAPPPALDRGAVAQWCYRSADGHPLFWMQRITVRNGGKAFLHRVWLDGAWHRPRRTDPFGCEWPAPRPLYNLPALTARPDAPVLVVEGEKAADAAARLFPAHAVVTWPNGAKATGKADWKPLAGREVLLSPDADEPGRLAMEQLCRVLQTLGCTVAIVPPPDGAPDGWDLADAECWGIAEADEWLARAVEQPDPQPQHEPAQPAEPPAEPEHREPFVLLGFDGDAYYYQPHSTGQVMRLARSAHTSTNLVALAPLEYWEAVAPGKTGPNWTAVAARLFRLQAAVGVYQPARIRGRGAWWDQGQPVLHLGDRLIVAGRPSAVSEPQPGSRALYQRLGALTGPGDAEPLDDVGCQIIAALAERFRWEVPASGTLLAGWAALAPICGALPWRPHCWLTGAAGSGKSAILDRFVIPLIGDMGLVVLGNTTEPGIRQALRADALPVVFDEAEGNERNDQQRIQAVLGLARVASSESAAQTLKGTPEGDAQRFVIRSMFLFSSIAHGLKQGADLSRFAQLTLRSPNDAPPEEVKAHWSALDADLGVITREMGQRLQSRTIRLIPAIRQSVGVLTTAAAAHFQSQRLGDQYGTLLAGAWSLQSDQPISEWQAQQFIAQNDWEPYSQATEAPDEQRCLQRILQHQLRVEGQRTVTRTIGELVLIAAQRQADIDVGSELAGATLERHGVRLDGAALVISNTAREVAAILSDTAWSNCWSTVLARLPGAERTGATRFRGLGSVSRGTRLALDALSL